MGNNKSTYSIQTKFISIIGPIIAVFFIALGIIIFKEYKNNNLTLTENSSAQIAEGKAIEIGNWLQALTIELERIAEREDVRSMQWDSMATPLSNISLKRNNVFSLLFIVYPDGSYYMAGQGKASKNLSEREYVKDIFSGKNFSISNPSLSKSTGDKKFNIAVPIKSNNGEIVGCLAVNVNLETISNTAAKIKIADSGFGFIVDSKGVIMAHPNEEYLMSLNLTLPNSGGFIGMDKVAANMLQAKSGKATITNPDGIEDYIIYTPIPNSPGWSIGISVPENEIFKDVYNFIWLVIILFGIAIVITFMTIFTATRQMITIPLSKIEKFILLLSNGDLSKDIDYSSNDEIGHMAISMQNMKEKLYEIVNAIIDGSEHLVLSCNEVSNSSQIIAEGASEQAGSVEEVSATMEQISANIEQNTHNSQETEKVSNEASTEIKNVRQKSELAIKTSNDIANKITIISDIAFQTNILALNAAVEAARAGEQGKGFAIVAAEVRKLAENSKIAAEAIVELANDGLNYTKDAGKVMEKAIPKIENTSMLIQEISASSIEQSNGVNQINTAIQQFTSITQQNASASEELAANAEEMAGQSKMLKDIVSFFKI